MLRYDDVKDAAAETVLQISGWGLLKSAHRLQSAKVCEFCVKILFALGIFANAAVSCRFLCSILAAPL